MNISNNISCHHLESPSRFSLALFVPLPKSVIHSNILKHRNSLRCRNRHPPLLFIPPCNCPIIGFPCYLFAYIYSKPLVGIMIPFICCNKKKERPLPIGSFFIKLCLSYIYTTSISDLAVFDKTITIRLFK